MIVEPEMVRLPALLIPAPVAADPPVIARPPIVAVTPASTWSTPTAPPPLIVTVPDAGPWIATGVTVLDRTRVPRAGDRVIVCGEENSTVLGASKVVLVGLMFAGLALVLTLAQPTPVRRVLRSLESEAVVTRYSELAL